MPLTHSPLVAMITTKDRKVAEPFYETVLGLARVPGDPFAAIYDCAGVRLRLTEVPIFEASAFPVLGWQVADIEGVADDLADRGVTMAVYEGLPQDDRGIWTGPDGTKVAFFHDPDGNSLSLTQPA